MRAWWAPLPWPLSLGLLVVLPLLWLAGVHCRPGWLFDRYMGLRNRALAVARELDRRSVVRHGGGG